MTDPATPKPQAIDPKTALTVLKFIWKYAKTPYAKYAARRAWKEQKAINTQDTQGGA